MIEQIKNKVKRRFFKNRSMLHAAVQAEKDEDKVVRKISMQLIDEICEEEEIVLTEQDKKKIVDEIVEDAIGFGSIKPLLIDPNVTEIMINGFDSIYIEKKGRKELTDIKIADDRQMNQIIERVLRFCPRHVDQVTPFVDAVLPDGSRVNIIIPPLALNGAAITIRKFSWELNEIDDLVKLNTLTEDMAKFLTACIKARLNIMFSGATGSGKTTTLNVLTKEIDSKERIITIEDTPELQFNQKHVVPLLTKQPNIEGKGEISIRQLFRNTLRMRPDRIIIGEIRSEESIDLLQAIASGHVGSLGVIHGLSPADVVSRIETMIILSDIDLPIPEVRKQIASCLNLIVQQERFVDGVRRITHITEVRGLKNQEVELVDLFKFVQKGVDGQGRVIGDWTCGGNKPLFMDEFAKKGVKIDSSILRKI